jgi:site-specific recombinase XerD
MPFYFLVLSHLVMGGVDLPTVKKLMGHSDIETTMIYSHLADEHVDKAVEKLDFNNREIKNLYSERS